jgi:hypothetical protein
MKPNTRVLPKAMVDWQFVIAMAMESQWRMEMDIEDLTSGNGIQIHWQGRRVADYMYMRMAT